MKVPTLILLCASCIWAVPLNKPKALAVRANINGAGRIVGGSEARAGQFPYAASIVHRTADGAYFCAGTLVNNQWIVTAGQCVYNGIRFDINVGTNDRQGSGGKALSALNFLLPSEFSISPIMNDIGLIRLELPVVLNDYIKPVTGLATAEMPSDYEAVAIGWGVTSDSDDNFAENLRWVYVITLSNDECKLTYGDQVTDEKVCVAGNLNEGTCAGDMGGPLIHYPTYTVHTLVGVSSFISQNGCESADPSGFTRVFPFTSWIQNVTAKTSN